MMTMKGTNGMGGDLARRRGYGVYDYHHMIHPLNDAGIENTECKNHQPQVRSGNMIKVQNTTSREALLSI